MFDPNTPSVARTYDYLLGGKDNYPVDREVGEIFVQKFPGAVRIAQDNRACLVRAVTYIASELGVDQFIDLGSGLPTADNVHQVAQRVNPGARIAYVDNDPIVLAHGRAMLEENDNTKVVAADIRHPAQILDDPDGDHDWSITAEVDLAASDEAGEAVVRITAVGPSAPW